MISQKSRYALKALVELSKGDLHVPVLSGDIARRANIPKRFLDAILQALRQQGVLISVRGISGGYRLVKDPREVTVGEILRITEGSMAPLPCLSRTAYRRCEDCDSEEDCEVRRALAGIAETTRQALDSTTIADSLDPLMRKKLRLS